MREILIIDENQARRAALRAELAGGDLMVGGECGPGPEAFNLAREIHPAAIIVSLEEPMVRSLKTIEALSSSLPECPIVAISSASSSAMMRKAMLAGAKDFLGRPFQKGELVDSLRTVIQHTENRRLARQVRSGEHPVEQGCTIAVFAPKGGVGATTLAINLGVSMAEAKHNVALVDLNTNVGGADVMLNLTPQHTLTDVTDALDQMDGDLLRTYMTQHPSGLHILAAPADPGARGPASQGLEDLLALMAATYEYVLLDVPTRFDEQVEQVLRNSTYVLLLTSLEVASVRTAKRHLDTMKNWEFARDKIKVVMNVVNTANSVGKADIEGVLGFPVFWQVPYDPQVAVATQTGQSLLDLCPKSKTTQAITSLHYALTGIKPVDGGGSPFRLFGRK